jgi:subtilisin family serine protease
MNAAAIPSRLRALARRAAPTIRASRSSYLGALCLLVCAGCSSTAGPSAGSRSTALAGADAGIAASRPDGELAGREVEANARSGGAASAAGATGDKENGTAEPGGGARQSGAGGAAGPASLPGDGGTSAEPHVRVMVTLAAAPPPIWSQITVDLERTYRLRTVFAWSMQSLGERCIVFEAPSDPPIEGLLRRLASDPRVQIVQRVQRFTTQAVHTASLGVPLQHSAQALRLAQAHRWATGKGVRVAVIDTGVDIEHPELRGRISKVGNFVDRGGAGDRNFVTDIHGTAVAGVIVAAMNADIGLVGVAPQAQVFALKACWQERPDAREAVCDSYTLAKAIDYAISQGAQVLNFSLAGPPDPLLAKLVAAALARGIVVVAADGPDAARSFPASQAGVLGVAGSDDLQGGMRFPARRLAAGTLAAPGVDILTTVPHGHYDFFSGASFAAAQVSGVVALLLERVPGLTPVQVASLFHRTARPIRAAPGDAVASIDQIDACAALAASVGGGCT